MTELRVRPGPIPAGTQGQRDLSEPGSAAFAHGHGRRDWGLEAHGRTLRWCLMIAIAGMPLLNPPGPGNTSVVDLAMVIFVVAATVWLARERVPVQLPYALGAWLMICAGSMAAYAANSLHSGLAVAQDVFLFVWGATIASVVAREPGLLAGLRAAWAWSGLVAAAALVTGKVAGLDWLAGVSARDGGRAALTFGDPNLAGNYLVVCLFVILACRYPRHDGLRRVGCGVIVTAVLYTGSNGALLGALAGAAVALLVRVAATRGVAFAAAVAAAITIGAGALATTVSTAGIREWAAESGPVLRDGIGRSDDSSYARSQLVAEAMNLYSEGNLIGVGPARTEQTLREQAAPYVKEAHNDYTGTLVERGLLGAVGLIALMCSIGYRLGRLVRRPLAGDYHLLVPRPAWLLAIGVSFLVSGAFYEVLHFRHLWAFLGLVAGLEAVSCAHVAGRGVLPRRAGREA